MFSIIPSCIHFPISSNVPTLPAFNFCVSTVSPLFVAFSPFPLLFLLLSTLIYLNLPPGENRSLPQSGTNCFVRFMSPEPNPDKRSLVRPLCYLFFAKVTDWAVIKVCFVPPCCICGDRKARSLTAHQSCHIKDKGPTETNAGGTNQIIQNFCW